MKCVSVEKSLSSCEHSGEKILVKFVTLESYVANIPEGTTKRNSSNASFSLQNRIIIDLIGVDRFAYHPVHTPSWFYDQELFIQFHV